MTTEWDDTEELGDEDDTGLLGGGGPAETMDPGDEDDAALDEHGDNLAYADEEEV